METFKKYADRWLDDAVHIGEGTRKKYLGHLRTHILPTFGDRHLGDIQRSHVKSWVAAMSRGGSSPRTVATVYRTFAAIMRSAEVDEVTPRSPCIDEGGGVAGVEYLGATGTEPYEVLLDADPAAARSSPGHILGSGLLQT